MREAVKRRLAATPKEKVDAEINKDPVEDEAENLVIELHTSL